MVNEQSAPGARRYPDIAILVGLGYFAAAVIAITLTRAPGGIALIWPANGIVAALLI
jgi:integral membrane sensor domain MASE1